MAYRLEGPEPSAALLTPQTQLQRSDTRRKLDWT